MILQLRFVCAGPFQMCRNLRMRLCDGLQVKRSGPMPFIWLTGAVLSSSADASLQCEGLSLSPKPKKERHVPPLGTSTLQARPPWGGRQRVSLAPPLPASAVAARPKPAALPGLAPTALPLPALELTHVHGFNGGP